MTSSLVGSEMCIRDSFLCVDISVVARAWMGAVGAVLASQQRRGPRKVPVSYTHLTLPTICSV
eukprot:4760818-Prorocentrum_lima.AAC.1